MNNYIGENIKNLRRKKNITQEDLSEYLNVSFQTVSKWERGENLPDINTLMSLANYFDVSTDELLGMDKQRDEFFSYEFGKNMNILLKEEKYDEAINKYRNAQKVYPNNMGIISGLAMTLALRGEDSDKDEALDLCKRILGDMQYEKIKTSVRTTLFIIMKNSMTHEEALNQVRRLTHIWESREMITVELYTGDERVEYLKNLCRLVISILYAKIEHGQLSDAELIRDLQIGPRCYIYDEGNPDTALKELDRIKDFISQ